jgi:L-ribulose-5-phosphate 3-epimerase
MNKRDFLKSAAVIAGATTVSPLFSSGIKGNSAVSGVKITSANLNRQT